MGITSSKSTQVEISTNSTNTQSEWFKGTKVFDYNVHEPPEYDVRHRLSVNIAF